MSATQFLMQSPVGPMYLVASSEGLLGIHWRQMPIPLTEKLDSPEPSCGVLKQTVDQLTEYFDGHRKDFDLPLIREGTEFQKKVWQALGEIPYGATKSYSDIAKSVKNEKAVRAVGTANGRNPFSIVVPCHRVIAADGTLGGYAGGLTVKEKLLALEKTRG